MNAVDYIIGKLESFISVFLSSKVRYEYDEKSRSHMIEVLPIEIYQQNDDYIEWESETFDEFISKYPSENICFISDDSLVYSRKKDCIILLFPWRGNQLYLICQVYRFLVN